MLQAAVEASKVIMDFYNSHFETEIKTDGSPVTQADIASSTCIKQILEKTGIPIIDEETEAIAYDIRKSWTLSWCVDPLDGTKEFIKKNGEFAINIALIENEHPIFGLIAAPVKKEIIIGGKNLGVYIINFESINSPDKWVEIKPESNKKVSLIGSRSHHSNISLKFIDLLTTKYGKYEMIKKGSALKFFDLAEARATIYPRFAPTMEWDIAAGQAILEELNGKIIDATTYLPLSYNKEDLKNPSFIALTESFVNDFKPKN